jgi:hypothetical protein
MPQWITIARWVHILASAAWLGEVITIVFVVVPALRKLPVESRKLFIASAFPRIFRWASVFALTSILAGLWFNYLLTGWVDPAAYFFSPRGLPIFVGGLLGLLLATFHFFIEGRLEARVVKMAGASDSDQDRILRYLTIIPRGGLAVMTLIFVLMMVGARGY